jgi:exodeoxyribonuclease V alpha subunit
LGDDPIGRPGEADKGGGTYRPFGSASRWIPYAKPTATTPHTPRPGDLAGLDAVAADFLARRQVMLRRFRAASSGPRPNRHHAQGHSPITCENGHVDQGVIPAGDSTSVDRVSGLIERVTYFNEESGFCVLRVKAGGHRDLVTVVGSLPAVSAGAWIHAEGVWMRDKEYGLQLKATTLNAVAPTTVEGIEKYLGSGMVKGVGPVFAQRLVERFGAEVLAVIEQRPGDLEQVDGIGPKRRQKITGAWDESKRVREIMVFLHSHGVSTSRAVRIYKAYGDQAVERVRSNPYILAKDIYGIGFKTADQIAQNVGIPKNSMSRACAGIDHVLLEATSDGHCALPMDKLKAGAVKLLEVDEFTVEQALSRMITGGSLLLETIRDEALLFLPHLRRAEEGIAARIQVLAAGPPPYPPIDFEKAVVWCQGKTSKILAPSQLEALRAALASKVTIITGGPGVGKTTLVNSLLTIVRAKGVKCLLCAPTGRAAKRMTEATGIEAKTIHRLLEVDPSTGRFRKNETNPLDCDLLVMDETSMVDVPLMHSVLRAVPQRAGLTLVGDIDQLPSVGPGNVLRDLIDSGVVPVVRLTEVFRQAAHSRIITTAHSVRIGKLPDLGGGRETADFHFVERDDPEQIAATLVNLVQNRIPARFGLDPIRDVQVLCPMNRGSLGARELNLSLQRALNPARPGEAVVEKYGWRFQARDKVIQTENDYQKEVFNGDVGTIDKIDPVEHEVVVRFDDRRVKYDFGELDEISLAYAVTVHKAQGSEFAAVVIPLATQQYMLLQRNLIYTGITRGKRLVVLIGQRKALRIAVSNNKTQRRYSSLLETLRRIGNF